MHFLHGIQHLAKAVPPPTQSDNQQRLPRAQLPGSRCSDRVLGQMRDYVDRWVEQRGNWLCTDRHRWLANIGCLARAVES